MYLHFQPITLYLSWMIPVASGSGGSWRSAGWSASFYFRMPLWEIVFFTLLNLSLFLTNCHLPSLEKIAYWCSFFMDILLLYHFNEVLCEEKVSCSSHIFNNVKPPRHFKMQKNFPPNVSFVNLHCNIVIHLLKPYSIIIIIYLPHWLNFKRFMQCLFW